MALTLRRWIAIAVLACAAIGVWLLPARGAVSPWHNGDFRARFVPGFGIVRAHGWPDASTRLGQATLHLRLLQLRDSIFTPQVLAQVKPGLQLLVDRQIPDTVRRAMALLTAQTWQRYDAGSRYPTVVAVVLDTSSTVDGLPVGKSNNTYARVFVPDSAVPVCRVLVRIRNDWGRRQDVQNLERDARNFLRSRLEAGWAGAPLGPCAMYATFGQPGAKVHDWLERTSWVEGNRIAWYRHSSPWSEPAYLPYRVAAPLIDFQGLASRASQMRTMLSNDGIACVAGDADRCVAALLQPTRPFPGNAQWQRNVVDIGDLWYSWGLIPSTSLGPNTGWILSDLVHDLGRDRFAAFWTSNDDVPAAFQRATQQPLGQWLRQWAQNAYAVDVRGPAIAGRATIVGIIVLLAGLALATVFERERRVA